MHKNMINNKQNTEQIESILYENFIKVIFNETKNAFLFFIFYFNFLLL